MSSSTHRLHFLLLLLSHIPHPLLSQCHNMCSGHGTCHPNGTCDCSNGFRGGDCSQRICPSDVSFGYLDGSSSHEVHNVRECSGRGHCDDRTGRCLCMFGFTGIACERTTCSSKCHNRGMCLSQRQYASTYLNLNSQHHRYDHVWDADKIYGCACDDGYTGYDCSLRTCPTGDDPLTPGGVQEKQLLHCDATTAVSTFVLRHEGVSSKTIAGSATTVELQMALQSIPKVGRVSVTYSHGTTVCNDSQTNIATIAFLDLFGPLPPLVPYHINVNSDATIAVGADDTTGKMIDQDGVEHYAVKGSKENDVCSARGICDHGTGTCRCFDSHHGRYAGSDGYGNAGNRGDCGYAVSDISSCPDGGGGVWGRYVVSSEIPCHSRGVCDEDTWRCTCEEGFMGGDCSLRTCPVGKAWFSYPSADDVGHDEYIECSNKGICDRKDGECLCERGFFGAACEYMACASSSTMDGIQSSKACSGHGSCITIEMKAHTDNEAPPYYGSDPNNSTTWDAKRIFSCHCDDGYEGYDCSLKTCRKGVDILDPTNGDQVCSNHGVCNTLNGSCNCFKGWGDSDGGGTGHSGDIDDCGHRLSIYDEMRVILRERLNNN